MDEFPVTENHLNVEFRSDLRFFAFYVGNHSLFAGNRWKAHGFPYTPFLLEKHGGFWANVFNFRERLATL